jgi:hypothetical protein
MNLIKYFVFVFLLISNFCLAQPILFPTNLDFEQSQEGMVPYGWHFQPQFEKLGYQAFTTHQGALQGNFCLTLQSSYNDAKEIPNPDNKELQSVLYQEIEAEYFRGKEVFFGIKYKVLNPSDKNSALLFIQQENNDIHFFRLANTDTLRNTEWTETSISMMIDSTAKVIKFGVISFSTAVLQFDEGIFNYTYDFTKNSGPINYTEQIGKNLFNLAKVYGDVRYFYPNPFLKEYPWDVLLYDLIKKAVKDSPKDYTKKLLQTFSEINDNKKIETDKVNSASNFSYTGVPTKTATPLANQKISDIFVSNKEVPCTIINFLNIQDEKPTEVKISVKYKLKPYAYNCKGGLWLRFDDSKTVSLGEFQAEKFLESPDNWKSAEISAKVPSGSASIRIGLVLEGDGEIFFDDLQLTGKKNSESVSLNVRNGNFESPMVNNIISGWNFPKFSQNAGYAITLDNNAAEGKNSLKISSDKRRVIQFPQINSTFEDILSDGSIFSLPLSVPVSNLKNISFEYSEMPSNFSINYEDSYSRIGIIIEQWNLIRHFSLNKFDEISLNNAFLHAVRDANSAKTLEEFEKVLSNLAVITNDPNFKIWYGFNSTPYFPDMGIFIENNSVYSIQSDSIGIPNGSRIIAINNLNLDSLIKIEIILNKKNSLNNKFIINKKITNLLSGIKNSSKVITFENNNSIETKKIQTNSISLRTLTPLFFASEPKPGVIYLNSAAISDEEFLSLIPKLQESSVKGVIIDLRGYSMLSEHILGLFTENSLKGYISEIPIYTSPNHQIVNKSIMENNIKSIPKLKDKKVIFLINEFTNSYSELIAALARYNKIGQVIGTNTQGNIAEVEKVSLPGYFFGTQSIIRFKLIDDENYLFNSVAPDIKVEQTLKNAVKNFDDQLEKALELIR